MNANTMSAFITGIGLIAPGLPDWATAAAVLGTSWNGRFR